MLLSNKRDRNFFAAFLYSILGIIPFAYSALYPLWFYKVIGT